MELLDKVSNVIFEMLPGAYETYNGNYTSYLKQREERIARRQEVFESEKEKLNKEMEYIRKNVAGQNVLQAKGKLKRLSRSPFASIGSHTHSHFNLSQLDNFTLKEELEKSKLILKDSTAKERQVKYLLSCELSIFPSFKDPTFISFLCV